MNILRNAHKSLVAVGISAALGLGAVALAAAPDSTDSSATVGAAITDTAITTQVKAKFASDDRLKNSDISVKTNNGVVTLTGSASSSSAKDAAETLATNVSGVKTVNDQLTAPSAASEIGDKARHATEKTASAVEDTAITTALKTKFAADSKTKGADIGVTTNNAIVALSGTVTSRAQKEHVIYVARHTKGVTQVDSTALNVSAQ